MRAAVLVLVLVACNDARPPDVELDGETMGGTWHVKIQPGKASRVDAARAMQTKIDAVLERVNDSMSTYRPNSEISKFNRHASTAPFTASAELRKVVAAALKIGAATDGAYDITLDPLITLWGFDRKGRRDAPPTDDEIKAAQAHTGLAKIAIEGDALVKRDPDVTINLGGIAAGYAVDEVGALLDAHGFADWMVEITGEVRAHGKNARGEPWKIGVKVPSLESKDVVAAVPLADRSLTTSGSYHNFFESGGKRYSHILDPRTGAPVTGTLVSVTVLAPDALTADGFDTPFVILGEERARAILSATPGMEALFIHQDGDALRVTTTAGFPKLEGAP